MMVLNVGFPPTVFDAEQAWIDTIVFAGAGTRPVEVTMAGAGAAVHPHRAW
jgi:hypothetical protein